MSARSDKWSESEALAVEAQGIYYRGDEPERKLADAVLALIAELRALDAALERLTEGEDIHERRDLQARLKDAEQALEYYADPTHYIGMMSPGATAREALNHLRKGRPLSQVPNGE